MTVRRRSSELSYAAFRKTWKPATCNFCDLKKDDGQTIKKTKYFWVAKNIFPYNLWDNHEVDDHLMLLPIRHVDSLAKLTRAEHIDYIATLSRFEARGYSIYSRAVQNKSKSVPHLHTHLIKLRGEGKKFYLFLRKPYLLWYK